MVSLLRDSQIQNIHTLCNGEKFPTSHMQQQKIMATKNWTNSGT